MNTLIGNLRQAVHSSGLAVQSDAQLLATFVLRRDEAAFATMVRRHGPMILGTCRRITRHTQDAEDAFQATFLVLARKAASVRPGERLASWLHGVACRTALRARSLSARRHTREKQVMDMPHPEAPPQDLWPELRPIIDQELNQLSEIYRLPILLVDLEGRSLKEATRLLRWPQGTVAGRLSRGRKLLAQRLARRGLTFAGASLTAALTLHATSTCQAGLVQTTTAAALHFAGGTASASVASLAACRLARGVLHMMLLGQLKLPVSLAGLLVIAALLAGSALPGGLVAAGGPTPTAAPALAPIGDPVEEPAWKQEFRTAYGLKAGEDLKRVAPPYPACRDAYLRSRFERDAGNIPFEDHFTVLRWKGDWAPPELSHHTLPIKPNQGVALARVLDMTACLSRIQLKAPFDLLEEKVTGDFVVRHDAPVERIVAQLETVLNRDCGLAVKLRWGTLQEEVFVLSGNYTPRPLPERREHQIELYAEHLTDRTRGGGGSGDFQELLDAAERYVGRRVVMGKITGLPQRLSWHYNVRSPMLSDPLRGIDTLAEDTNPLAVLNNIAAQTGLKLRTERREVRVLHVERPQAK